MKLHCEVLEVSTDGENLTIKMQGKPKSAADWRGWALQTLKIPDNEIQRKTYYVGRRVVVRIGSRP